jgi:hypothetical protein
MTMSKTRTRGLGGPDQVHLAEDGMDRDELIDKLTDLGFQLPEIENAPDETLAAILRVYAGPDDEDEDEDDDEDEDEFDEDDEDEQVSRLPKPRNEEERQALMERAKTWISRGRKALRHYSDDANSRRGASDAGTLASGTSRSTEPEWDAAHYRQVFAENEAALKQFGITSPEALKKHREGRRVMTHCDLPRQAKEGRGLADRFSEEVKKPRGRWASETYDAFAEDFKLCQVSRPDYIHYVTKLDEKEFATERERYKARRLARAN